MEATSPCTRQATERGPKSPSGRGCTGLSPRAVSLNRATTCAAIARLSGRATSAPRASEGGWAIRTGSLSGAYGWSGVSCPEIDDSASRPRGGVVPGRVNAPPGGRDTGGARDRASGLDPQQLRRRPPEHVELLLIRQRVAGEDVVHRLQRPGIGII